MRFLPQFNGTIIKAGESKKFITALSVNIKEIILKFYEILSIKIYVYE